jgi:hypothetical protein
MRATRFSAAIAAVLLASTLGATMVFAQSNQPSPSERAAPAPDDGMMGHGKMERSPMMDMSQMNRMMEDCNRMMEGMRQHPQNPKPDNG